MQFHGLHAVQAVHNLQPMKTDIGFLDVVIIFNTPGVRAPVLNFDKVMLARRQIVTRLVTEYRPNAAHDETLINIQYLIETQVTM